VRWIFGCGRESFVVVNLPSLSIFPVIPTFLKCSKLHPCKRPPFAGWGREGGPGTGHTFAVRGSMLTDLWLRALPAAVGRTLRVFF